MNEEAIQWLKFTGICVVAILLLAPVLMISPAFQPQGDSLGQYRAASDHWVKGIESTVLLILASLALNFVTDGNWFKAILEGNIAVSIVTGFMFLAIAIAL